MLEYPWFLLLLLLPVVFLVYRNHRYYLRHAYVKSLMQINSRHKKILQFICMSVGWILLVLAAVNFFWGYTTTVRRQPIHKFVMINDGSGSMVEINKPRGMGERLTTLNKGNEALLEMLNKRNDGSRDLVGAIVFSNSSFVVSYMVDDPKFVSKKLSLVDYRRSPLGAGTELDWALWGGIDMILSNEKDVDDDLIVLRNRMFGVGHNYKKEGTEHILTKYKAVAEYSCIIIFTDGEFDNPAGLSYRMSLYKLLSLCKDLGIRVYVISVATVDNFIERYTNDTGGFAQIFTDFEENKFRKAYQNIFKSQTTNEIVVEEQVRKPLGTIFGLVAFGFICLGLLLRLTFDRSFTEV